MENTILITFLINFTGIVVGDIKPVKPYLLSLCFFVLAVFGMYISVMVYGGYFLMRERVFFSFPFASPILGMPLFLYFSYLLFYCGYKKKIKKINKVLLNVFGLLAVIGILFSFLFSFYVTYDLTSNGYVICPKKSIIAPTEYVLSKDMCE